MALSTSITLLIAVCAVGGAILLVFLGWLAWRLQKGDRLMDVLKLRREEGLPLVHVHDEKDYQVQMEHKDEIQHKIQMEQRYSVRSSYHQMPRSPARTRREGVRSSQARSPSVQRFSSKDAYQNWYMNSHTAPASPAIDSRFSRHNGTRDKMPSRPQTAHLTGRSAHLSPASSAQRPRTAISQLSSLPSPLVPRPTTAVSVSTPVDVPSPALPSGPAPVPVLFVAPQVVSGGKSPSPTKSDFSPVDDGRKTTTTGTTTEREATGDKEDERGPDGQRWSWTNSEAPPTPRLHYDRRRSDQSAISALRLTTPPPPQSGLAGAAAAATAAVSGGGSALAQYQQQSRYMTPIAEAPPSTASWSQHERSSSRGTLSIVTRLSEDRARRPSSEYRPRPRSELRLSAEPRSAVTASARSPASSSGGLFSALFASRQQTQVPENAPHSAV